jgi:FtsP/CotA-like multicopper oxidase with cupredoxin domain
MHTIAYKRMPWVLVLMLVALLLSTAPMAQVRQVAAASSPSVGVVCTTAANSTFALETTTGYITLGDGNTMFMWGYAEVGHPFQHPSPVLCVNEGDTVTVTLKNNLPEAVSIMFPGQDDVLANGVPAQPAFSGTMLDSLTNTAGADGGSITYSFVASHPGTFLYESGTDPRKQVGMGLFGALIVRPSSGADYANNQMIGSQLVNRFTTVSNSNAYTWDEEFLVLLSEIDPYLHQAVELNLPYEINTYHVRYWLLNGRGFPDTIADNFASWLPNQPYGALARVHEFNDTLATNDINYHPYPALIRYLNVGTEDYPFHPHGNNGLVIARDGRPLVGSTGADLSFEKFDINLGAGQTWDVLSRWYDAENYAPTIADAVPVTVPDVANQVLGMMYSGSPYLGVQGNLPPGANSLNQCGEYYIISHNHALNQLDAWGVTMAGPITYLRIDPPLGPNNTCP